jgi:anthranilate phosphoribosyltransferase
MAGIKEFIQKVCGGSDLLEDEASRAFQIMMMGGATPAQMSALLVGLKMKGETVDEIAGAAQVMRAKCGKIDAPDNVLDTCGTGGDQSGSFNVSTAVAFVVAACGVPVAKHGNRAISSKSGSADVLKALGVNVEADVSLMERALRETNICFLMAPKFHTAMRHVAPVREEIGVRTIFNILGPLANPASTQYQLVGVYSDDLVEPIVQVLKRLGTKRAWVVHGSDGMDEITTTGSTFVASLNEGNVSLFHIHPDDVGIPLAKRDELLGGDARYNAEELKNLLEGNGNEAYRNIVIINAAASLLVSGKVKDLQEGVNLARETLESGKAYKTLQDLVSISNSGEYTI